MDTLLYLLKFMKGIALKRWGGGLLYEIEKSKRAFIFYINKKYEFMYSRVL